MMIRLYEPLQIDFFHSRTLRTTPAFPGWQVSDGIGSQVSLETSYHSFYFRSSSYPSSVSGLTPWSRRKQMLLSSFSFSIGAECLWPHFLSLHRALPRLVGVTRRCQVCVALTCELRCTSTILILIAFIGPRYVDF